MTETYDVAIAPYCPLGSIALAACMQVDLATPKFVIQEMSLDMHYNTEAGEYAINSYIKNPGVFEIKNRHVDALTAPGLGIDMDKELRAVRSPPLLPQSNPPLFDGNLCPEIIPIGHLLVLIDLASFHPLYVQQQPIYSVLPRLCDEMTSDPLRPGLHPLSHLKAGPTTSSTKSTALPVSPSLPSFVPSPTRPQLSKHASREDPVNATSDKATVALIRRVLCPQTNSHGGVSTPQPPEDLLPPLTSSNEVDRQLYALIAIIVKEFVSTWYSKITPDQALVSEVLQIIAHCTRTLEQRLRDTDVAQLVLDEIPALIETHIVSYRLAKQQSELSDISPSLREIYHTLNPHPGLSPVPDPSEAQAIAQQQANESVYRQLLVQGVLAVLLPSEDLENACVRALVGDIMADLVLGNAVAGKISEGWFLWESITKVINMAGREEPEGDAAPAAGVRQRSQLHEYGLLSSREEHTSSPTQVPVPDWVWQVLQYGYMVYVTLRFIVIGLFRVASAPPATSSLTSCPPTSAVNEAPTTPRKRPVLNYRLPGMLSQLMDIPRRMPWLGGFLALIQYLILAGPGRLGDTDSVLDRFLYETIQDHVLTPALLPNLLLASRAALFPLNARPASTAADGRTAASAPQLSVQPPTLPLEKGPVSDTAGASDACSSVSTAGLSATAPLSPDPRASTPDVASIKRRCAASILSRVPRPMARRFFGVPAAPIEHQPSSQRQEQPSSAPRLESPWLDSPRPPSIASLADCGLEESLLLAAVEDEVLDLFADDYCNKHLIYSIIEAVLSKLLPELSARSVAELMEDRGVRQALN
ncbi:hypothetical protein BO70DRAFT_399275 [Aspergillus heteromorphus CBS 117.55]|uniref:PXA domain-containing protein n=1 Tax=Aspergillus heteromorphus CBS 117.55 TaxID=1448321 RepID=A0A317VH81_9EURO|nr:uncharacterized protein BO70DRAFT_399275 [Aspergillus heteromorphus CBS 117.55]PWY72398.1 hypothetical protein BO70DRAFT_399275 [Aspergillus heteromorphus CBS 117.55]